MCGTFLEISRQEASHSLIDRLFRTFYANYDFQNSCGEPKYWQTLRAYSDAPQYKDDVIAAQLPLSWVRQPQPNVLSALRIYANSTAQ